MATRHCVHRLHRHLLPNQPPLPRFPPLRSFSDAPSPHVQDASQRTQHARPPPTRRTVQANDQLQDEIYDLATVGGGIVGLACTRELLTRHQGLRAVVLEKESSIAQHQSSHNSGVVHAGVYYKPGSLRAQLCTKGARMLYKYCDQNDIPYKQVGKLIVALNEREAQQIDVLHERAAANGVPDLQVLHSQAEIHQLEPHITGVKALYTPFTGIINYGDVAQSYACDVQHAGGKIVTDFTVKCGEQLVTDTNQSYVSIQSSDGRTVRAKRVLVAGGLYADRLAACFGGEPKPTIIPFRGSWLVVGKQHSNLVTRNVYPVPNPQFPFLGVHITPRLNGELLLGPTAALAFSREGYKWNSLNIRDIVGSLTTRGFQKILTKHFRYGCNELLHDLFSRRYALPSIQQYMPSLEWSHITDKFSGVRAQSIGDDGALIEDFIFQSQGSSILHIRNAPSPAATSSLAIAERVADKAAEVFRL